MKTLKLMLIVPLMALCLQTTFATGLYLTAKDYQDHKLSFNGDKINLRGFFNSTKVTVVHDGKPQTFLKSEIFGYQDAGQDYRFFDNKAYRILENKEVILYAYAHVLQQGKGLKPVEQFYFSSDHNEPIMVLTKANLEKAYGKNPKFVYALEASFQKRQRVNRLRQLQ